MSACCDNNCAIDQLRSRQKGTLIKVLWINSVMFLVIVAAAFYAGSSALLSDSLDNLGDAITYGLSLYAVSLGIRVKAKVALTKGLIILIGALTVISQLIWKLSHPIVPSYEIMGIFSLLGLAANSLCLWLLWQHRNEDINMSSVYECSRNDIATNLSVFLAAGSVWLFQSGWPDIIVAILLTALLLNSSIRIIKDATTALNLPERVNESNSTVN